MKKEMRLYNVIFPIWLLLFFPWFVFPAAALNFGIDTLVVLLALKRMGVAEKKQVWKKSIIRVVIFGFLGDIAGAMGMISMSVVFDEALKNHDAGFALMYDPWRNALALICTVICMATASLVIFLLDRRFAFNKTELSAEQKRKLAMSMAVFTTPLLFLLPTSWFW